MLNLFLNSSLIIGAFISGFFMICSNIVSRMTGILMSSHFPVVWQVCVTSLWKTLLPHCVCVSLSLKKINSLSLCYEGILKESTLYVSKIDYFPLSMTSFPPKSIFFFIIHNFLFGKNPKVNRSLVRFSKLGRVGLALVGFKFIILQINPIN